MRIIFLTKGQHTVVDDDVYEWAAKFNWFAQTAPSGGFYAARKTPRDARGKQGTVWLHREIMGTLSGQETDHKNLNKLDNRRTNLRRCSHSENMANKSRYKSNTSGFKGVTFNKRSGKWTARVGLATQRIFLGYFTTAFEAAVAYDIVAEKLQHKFAVLNFPKELS